MRIFNEEKTQEIQDYNKELYYLKNDKLLIKHHEAVEEIKQVSHLEVVRKNDETGGVEYKEIIDVPYQPAKEAYDEYEDIQVIISYTEKELNQNKINQLDNWFKTDYAKYEQMFNRRHFLAIEDTIVDEFRGKTYHNLGELYREGEDVAKEIRELKESLKPDTNQLTNNNQSVIMEVEN